MWGRKAADHRPGRGAGSPKAAPKAAARAEATTAEAAPKAETASSKAPAPEASAAKPASPEAAAPEPSPAKSASSETAPEIRVLDKRAGPLFGFGRAAAGGLLQNRRAEHRHQGDQSARNQLFHFRALRLGSSHAPLVDALWR